MIRDMIKVCNGIETNVMQCNDTKGSETCCDVMQCNVMRWKWNEFVSENKNVNEWMEHDEMRIGMKMWRQDEMILNDKLKCDKMWHDKWSVSEGEKWKEMKLSKIWRLWGGCQLLRFKSHKMNRWYAWKKLMWWGKMECKSQMEWNRESR